MTDTTAARQSAGPSNALIVVMAAACGVIVADLYYLQPLLHQIRGDFHVSASGASLLMTLAQVGYALGLALVAPLGDLVARRRLVPLVFLAAAAMMATAALLRSYPAFATVTLLVGVASVGAQMIVPFAADLAPPDQGGRVIARVMTGLLLGILLSRTASGLIAQAAGWRAVYWIAAATLCFVAAVLARVLPGEPARVRVAYRTLVAASFTLLATNSALRRRAWFGALAFAAFNVVWTTLSFHLSAAPFHYSKAVVGLFGLFGVAGVVAANLAGHQADRDRAGRTTIASAVLVVVCFALVIMAPGSVVAIAAALVALDAGMQGLQITNQSLVYSLVPAARSRVTSAYMMCCFAGASFGSYAGGLAYQLGGWRATGGVGVVIGVGLVVPALRHE